MIGHGEAARLLAAGAALEDLAPDEWREYEAHRRSCATCAELAVDLDDVLADLALIIPERMPPPDLFEGIRRAIASGAPSDAQAPSSDDATDHRSHPRTAAPAPGRAEPGPTLLPFRRTATADVVPDRPSTARSSDRRSSRLPVLASLGLAAAFGIVAVGLGSHAARLDGSLADATAAIARLEAELDGQSAVMAVAVDPAHRTASLEPDVLAPGATAYVVYVPGTSQAWLVAHGLPATPDGHGYQLWFADAAGVHGLGTYAYDGTGTFVAPFDVDLASSAAAMVTLEPSGGAAGEPGPQVVFGELAS